MSNIGSSSLAIAVTPSTRKLTCTGVVHFLESVAVTVSGFSPSLAANLVLLVLRGSTQVAAIPQGANVFAASGDDAAGTLDLATTELDTVFDGVADGAVRAFEAQLWDASSQELLGKGTLVIRQTGLTYAATSTVPLSTITPLAIGGIETIDGVECWVLKDSNGVIYASFPKP